MEQPSLYRSVCPFFLSFSLFQCVSCFYTFSASLFHSLSHWSVSLCMHRHNTLSFISPFSYLLFSLTNLALLPWQPHVSSLSLNAFHKSVSMGNVTCIALCPAPKRQQSHVTVHLCVIRMRSVQTHTQKLYIERLELQYI